MSVHIELADLVARVGPAKESPSRNTNLVVPPPPDPYVSPNFQIMEGTLDEAEVITISAPAAVGKSVTAQHLAATTRAPLLDLATVAVGEDSLRGLLSGYSSSPGRAIQAFHRAQLPVVVDALDEGALLSGIPALEAFVESAAAFVREGSRTPGRVKLLILGRDDSVRYRSNLVIELTSDVHVCAVRLDFFERAAAFDLIPLYAARELDRLHDNHQIDEGIRNRRQHALDGQPMRDLIEAHFDPIEFALGIQKGQLWDDEKGRAFAGYAPVLSSIGILLAEVDNPARLAGRLRQAGTNEAWRVIATVMDDVLEREQDKLKRRIEDSAIMCGDPYTPNEQLQHLTDLFHGRPLRLTDTLTFRDAAAARDYEVKVGQLSREHPFVKDSAMANDVLGSRVLAYAVMNDSVGPDLTVLKAVSRQPFLWRFVRAEASTITQDASTEAPLIDGRYLGCLLASYWNDPAEPDGRKVIVSEIARGDAQGLVQVTVNADDTVHEVSLRLMPPIWFYARLQDCNIETDDVPVFIEGSVARTPNPSSGTSAFVFRGDVSVVAPHLTYSSDAATLERCDGRPGRLWLEAADVEVNATNPAFDVDDHCEYGWGGVIPDVRPWAHLSEPTLAGPHEASTLIHLIYECQKRVRNRIVVESAYAIPRDDPSLNWARRDYGHVFSVFLRNLVDSELVATERGKDTAGRMRHYTINFGEHFWSNLIAAIRRRRRGDAEPDERYRAFLDACARQPQFGLE